MRILSIDYGKKRTGIAVTDPLQLIAGGLATVSTSELFEFLARYVAQEQVERIVVGKPMQPNGSPSENMARVEQFVARWRKQYPSIPIEYYDERYTSVLAHRTIIESGIRKKERRDNKGLVDTISATILLQDWMESQKYNRIF
ncbi:MAG: Holliday junction resolvase RuvX [Prevotellaceae bacterium]|nr:Holliday junction resolvase RuvX [Prevotellaceae bacterium]